MAVDYVGFVFAFCIAVGGIIGYFKAGSIPSLISGIIFGTVLTYGAYRITQDPTDVYVSLGASVILVLIMVVRYYTTQKFMPAGIIILISLLMVIKLSYQGISSFNSRGTSSNLNSTEINQPLA